MIAFKSLLLISVLFILVNSAHGNTSQAISDKDSMIIIFKGPTLEQDNNLVNQNQDNIVLNTSGLSKFGEGLQNHFQLNGKTEKSSVRMLGLNHVVPSQSLLYDQSVGIFNFNNHNNSSTHRKRVETIGNNE
jgi:hypothetical protein